MSARPARAPDAGFTLLEVVIAISLITIVMTGMLGFFISGVRASADREWKSSAVQVANEQMEIVRAVPVVGGAGLVQGRDKTAVTTQWNRGPSATYPGAPSQLAGMNPTWQAAPVASLPNIPLTRTVQVGTQRYEVNTFVGTCRAARTGGCIKTGSSGVQMYQIVVQVTWNQGHGTLGSYVLNTLIDPSDDPTFNTTP